MADPTLVHAAIVAAYAGSALACWHRGRGARASEARRFWRLAALALALLAVDWQFELLDVLTGVGRELAREVGWYAARRPLQRWFVYGVGAGGVALFGFAVWRLRPLSGGRAAVLAGVLYLSCLALARASSHHRVDAVLVRRTALDLTWGAWLELSGLAVVGLGVALAFLASIDSVPGGSRRSPLP